MSLIKKIGIFIIVLTILVALANIILRFVLPFKPVKIISSNMEPTYSKNDILFYEESESYNVNDTVLVFLPDRPPLVTRLIERNEDGTFNAKGDNNLVSLPFEKNIQQNQIIGKIKFSMNPYIFYGVTYGMVIILSVLMTFLIFSRKKGL